MVDRVQVVGSHHRTPGGLSSEVARVVAMLLIGMPLPPIDLDDDPSPDQQVDATDTRYRHLADALQARIDQSQPHQRLDTRLCPGVEQRGREAVASRNPLEQVLDLSHADETRMQSTVEHCDGEATRLAPHHVHESVDEARPRGLDWLGERPPVAHGGAARSRAGTVEVHVHARVGRTPEPERLRGGDAPQHSPDTDRLLSSGGERCGGVQAPPEDDDLAIGDQSVEPASRQVNE